MSAHYMTSSSYVEPTAEEAEYFDNNFNVDDSESYLSMPVYRTAFVAATSHEQRQQVIRDYDNYRYSADVSHRPGNWQEGDHMEYMDSEASELASIERALTRTETARARVRDIQADVLANRDSGAQQQTVRPTTSRDNFMNSTATRRENNSNTGSINNGSNANTGNINNRNNGNGGGGGS